MHNNIKQPKTKTNRKVIRDNNVKKCPQGIGRWDGIDMVEVANLFVGDNQQRKQLFGKFSKNDLPMKSTFASKATQTV